MHKQYNSWAIVAVGVVVVASLAAVNAAYSQVNASPSWTPIGVSSSGTSSTAWFHELSSRQVVACRTLEAPGGNLSSVKCVSAQLP